MNAAKASPRPWAYNSVDGDLVSAEGDDLGVILHESDGRLIVQSVNERDALLARVAELEAALEAAKSWLSEYHGAHTDAADDGLRGLFDQIRAALR